MAIRGRGIGLGGHRLHSLEEGKLSHS
jgi:hypothetical protein